MTDKRTMRDRLIERVARSLSWTTETADRQYSFRQRATRIVDDLYDAEDEGKAISRALKLLERQEEVA